jgi:uncharacterized protein YndB with AHSA1/START domain
VSAALVAPSATEGTIDRDGEYVVFRCERTLPLPVPRVWAALTEPALIERWLGRRPELDLRPGGAYVVEHGNGMRVTDRVLRADPPTLFEHTFWESVNPDATVTWELAEDGDGGTGDGAGGGVGTSGSRLTLTHKLSDADLDNAASTVAASADRGVIIARNAEGWRRVLDKLAASLGDNPDSN